MSQTLMQTYTTTTTTTTTTTSTTTTTTSPSNRCGDIDTGKFNVLRLKEQRDLEMFSIDL